MNNIDKMYAVDNTNIDKEKYKKTEEELITLFDEIDKKIKTVVSIAENEKRSIELSILMPYIHASLLMSITPNALSYVIHMAYIISLHSSINKSNATNDVITINIINALHEMQLNGISMVEREDILKMIDDYKKDGNNKRNLQ